MVKQGGWSYNKNNNSKKGITTRFKCSLCSRDYKQQYPRDVHERKCRTFQGTVDVLQKVKNPSQGFDS